MDVFRDVSAVGGRVTTDCLSRSKACPRFTPPSLLERVISSRRKKMGLQGHHISMATLLEKWKDHISLPPTLDRLISDHMVTFGGVDDVFLRWRRSLYQSEYAHT